MPKKPPLKKSESDKLIRGLITRCNKSDWQIERLLSRVTDHNDLSRRFNDLKERVVDLEGALLKLIKEVAPRAEKDHDT